MTICSVPKCNTNSYCKNLCKKHYQKLQRYGNPMHGKFLERRRGTGTVTADGYIEIKKNGLSRLEHILVAEKALGKSLPQLARVHHVDEDKTNNTPSNLVICPSDEYHQLLHRRMRAIAECGHADWLKCQYCKKWDEPSGIVVGKRVVYHKACKNEYERRRTAND